MRSSRDLYSDPSNAVVDRIDASSLKTASPETSGSTRVLWLDHARAAACLLVVLLHVTSDYLGQIHNIPAINWHFAVVVNSFTRASVPMFFMISGFLFFGRRAPTLKSFLRLLTCLAFYSSVALLFRIFFMGQSTESFDALLEAPVRPVFYHLWFFYPLFSVYLAAMFVQLRAPVSKVQIIALGLALFVLNPTSGDLRILGTGHDASDFAFFGFYSGSSVYFIFYGLTGAAIGALKDIERPRLLKISLWLLYAFVASTLAYLTDLSTLKMGEFDGKYMAPQNVLVAGVAVPLFLLFRFSSVKSSWFYAGLRFVSQHSLAIYGLHALVLFAIDSRGFRRFNQPLLDIPLTWLTVVAISLVLAAALRLVDRRRLFT